jgi:hypothetical protein
VTRRTNCGPSSPVNRMSDAFECDRCGELSGGPPDMELATGALTDVGGSVKLRAREPQPDAACPPQLFTTGKRRHNATFSIKGGDLCQDCAGAFREFWGESDE